MTKAWGSVGARAADSELAETKLHDSQPPQQHDPEPRADLDDAAFPSLGEAATSKSKKKKPQTFTLAQLAAGTDSGLGGGKPRPFFSGDSLDDTLILPTGPRARSDDDDKSGGLGGRFKDYGAYRGGRQGGDRDKDRDFGDGFGRKSRTDEPSRADDSDNWAASKKFAPPMTRGDGAYEDDRRRGNRMMNDGYSGSKADSDDNWGSNKKSTAPPPPPSGHVASRRYEDARGGSFFDSHNSSRADDVDDWGAMKKSAANLPSSDPPKWGRMDQERPRFTLQPRTRPVDSSPSPASGSDADSSTARASDGSEQDLTSPKKGEEGLKPRKPNPFGDAKPREVLLEQKGMDWRKLDAAFEHISIQRSETEEEMQLKKEIKALEEIIKSGSEGTEDAIERDVINVREELAKKERELEQLIRALDDKSRFAQTGRGSRAGNGKGHDVWTRSVSGEREKKEGRW